MQCKERVDLLEALKASRQESATGDSATDESNGKIHKTRTSRQSSEVENNERGFIGNGTIPAVSYPDLSRPGPPLPQRPPMLAKNSSERAVVGSKASSIPSYTSSSSSRTVTPSSSSTLAPPMKKSSRSPSPDKGRTLLHTLRSGDRSGRKASPRVSGTRRAENPVTNKAASLAWQSRGGRDRLGRSLDLDVDNSTTTLSESGRKGSNSDPTARPGSSQSHQVRYDSTTRRLVNDSPSRGLSPTDLLTGKGDLYSATGRSDGYPFPPTDPGQPGSISGSMLSASTLQDLIDIDSTTPPLAESSVPRPKRTPPPPPQHSRMSTKLEPPSYPTYLKEYPETGVRKTKAETELPLRRKPAIREGDGETCGSSSKLSKKPVAANSSSPLHDRHQDRDAARRAQRREVAKKPRDEDTSSQSVDDDTNSSGEQAVRTKRKQKQKQNEAPILADPTTPTSEDSESETDIAKSAWEAKVAQLMNNLPKGVDEGAARQIFNEIVIQGDEVHWDDVAGLEIAKKALKEAVVYPFLRPDLFMGLREPARGMLLFGPPGTGKTMLARAVATESRSTFFSISASSLTSKYLGESEKLVRALFSLAKALAPSIIFVDEIDSLLSSRSGSGEHEATRRIKTEFLIQWSDLQRAAAGREQSEKEKERGDASRVLVLAATNIPWAIDEAARRRFVRRQYIPLPEDETRAIQLRTLLGHQKHSLDGRDIQQLVSLTDGMLLISVTKIVLI
jgi:ATP-dependent 26S proteasome regulatory subunit